MSTPIDDDLDHGALLMDYLEEYWRANGISKSAWCREARLPGTSVGRWREGVEPEIPSLKRVAAALNKSFIDVLIIAGHIKPEDVGGRTVAPVDVPNVERAIALDPSISEEEREALSVIHRALHGVATGRQRSVRIRSRRHVT